MGKFNFEDYRQPWETGPHWELKREFMEKYSDMFPEDRLLCLAQAYSNIVIMNCSYPGPVMHQIRILAKPLEMCKKFQHSDFTSTDEKNQEGNKQSVSGKMKLPQCFDRTFKKIKFCKTKSSSDGSSSASQEVTEVFHNEEPSVLKLEETDSKSCEIGNSSSKANPSLREPKKIASELQDIISRENREIFNMPAEKFQNFLEKIQVLQKRNRYPLQCIINAAMILKIKDCISFKIIRRSFNPLGKFCATFSINGKEVCSENGNSKKEARSRVASSAIDCLINAFSDFKHVLKENSELDEEIPNTSPETVPDIEVKVNSIKNESVKDEDCKANEISMQKGPFVLNRALFDNSRTKGFALIIHFCSLSEFSRLPTSVLQESAAFCGKSLNYASETLDQKSSSHKVHVLLNNEVVGTGTGDSHKSAQVNANANAFEYLRKACYSIKVKTEYMDGFTITREQVTHGISFTSNPISENSIGCKMLKNMGWQGGGLGANGITEPVQAQDNHFTRGLGYGSKVNKKKLMAMLKDYANSNSFSDLIFSKEFTSEERKDIHEVARRFGLRNASRGKGKDRFLVIRKKYDVIDILDKLVAMSGSCGKFELVDLSNESVEV